MSRQVRSLYGHKEKELVMLRVKKRVDLEGRRRDKLRTDGNRIKMRQHKTYLSVL